MPDFASSLTVAQYRALGFGPAPGPHPVAIRDTGAAIAAMTFDEFEMLAWQGIDLLDATDGVLSLTVEQYTALGGDTPTGGDGGSIPQPGTIGLLASDMVTLADTRLALSGLTAARIAALAGRNIDRIDSTDDQLTLTVAKYNALGAVALTAGDVVTLADTGAALAALTAAQIAALAGKGVDRIDATNNVLALTVAQYQALGPVTLAAADVVTLVDTGAALAALTAAQIAGLAGKGIDQIDATDNALTLSLAQYQALGAVTLTAADVVTLVATGAALAALTAAQIAALAPNGIDRIDATDDTLALTVAQYTALGPVTLTAADAVILADTGAALAALTAAQIAALAGKGVDRIDATNNALALTVAQYTALGAVVLTAGDTVTLADTGAALAGLTAVQIAALAGKGIDQLDATNNALTLSLAQYQALGAVTLTAADTVTLADAGAALSALTAVQIAALAGRGIDRLDATNDALTLTVAQYQALGVVTLSAADVVTLTDTGSALAALTAAQIAALAGKGIDRIDASNNVLTLTVAKYTALGAVTLTAADVVTLADKGAALAALTAVQIAALATRGIDRIDATNNVLALTVAQYTALGAVTLTAADGVTLADTGAALAALTPAQIAALAGKGIDGLDATDNTLTLTAAQYAALGTVTLAAADTVTLVDTSAALASLTAAQFAALAAKGVDRIDATDDSLTLSVAQFTGLGAITLTAADVVTLADTGTALSALTAAQIATLAGKGIDRIDATDDVFTLSLAMYGALGAVTLTAADVVTLADTGAALAALPAAQISTLSGKGIDRLDATDNALSLTTAQYLALGSVVLTASDVVTLADTGATLAALSVGQVAALAGKGVDRLDATDDALVLSVAKYQSLGTVTLTASDVVTLTGKGGELAALTAVQMAALAGNGIDILDATNNALVLTVAQYSALGSVALTAADVVTLADTGAALASLTAAQIAALAGKGIDRLDATNNALALTVAQYTALGAVALIAADVVTLADTGAALAALTAVQISALAGKGIDRIDVTDNVLALSLAQYQALGAVTLTAADVVTLADTGTALAALSAAQIAALAGKGIDRLDATDVALTLSLAQYQALGAVTLATGNVVTLAGTGAALAALTAAEIAALAGKGVDRIDATDDVLVLSAAQAKALGAVTLTAADVVTLADTGAAIAALTAAQLAALQGIDRIDATNDTLALTVTQYLALGAIALTAIDVVTLADTGAALAGLTAAQIAALAGKGIDRIDATNDALTLSRAQYQALGTVTLAAADVVTVADTGAALAALTSAQIVALAGKGVDRLDATDNALTLSLGQYQSLGTVTLAAADVVTLADTGTALAALTPAQIAALAGKNIDRLDATDGALALTVAQYTSLGTVTLTAADTVTLADTGTAIAALTAAQFSVLAGTGIDRIDATNNVLALSVARYLGLGTVALTAADVVTLTDTGSALAGLTDGQIAALAGTGIDRIDATDNVLVLTLAQYTALGTVTLTAADAVTLADTGAALAALTPAQITALAGKAVDRLDATDDALVLTIAQYNALGAITLTASDAVTLSGTGAALAALTPVQIAALAGKGIDRLDATNNALTLSVAQYQALGTVALTAADVVTLADTGAALSALTPVQIAALAGNGVDRLDATNEALTLTVAQYSALGAVTLTAADVVTLADSGAALAALSSVQIAALAGKGVDRLDATDDTLSLSVAQYRALGVVTLAAADVVTLADTGAALAALTTAQLTALAAKGIDRIDATDNALSFSVAQYQALGAVTLAAGDVVTLADTGAKLAALTPAQIAALAGRNVDRIDASNNTLSLTVAQFMALGAVLLTAADTVTLADTSANLHALTAAQLAALAGKGIDRIDATDNVLVLSLADYQALGAVVLTAADAVTLADTGASLAALTPAQIAALAGKGFDAINATDDMLTLTVAQYRALGTVVLTGADYVILADTAANLATLTSAENAALTSKGIDEVQATDNTTIETALASYTLDSTATNLTFIGTGPFQGTGNALDNVITGGASGDTLRGLAGNDTLIGLAGDDTLIGGLGADVLNGGAGSADWASYIDATAGVTASLANAALNTGEAEGDTYIGIERLAGSAFDDTLIGNEFDNSLRGLGGADHLDGGAGRDTASYFTAASGLTVSLANPGLNTGEAAGDTYVSIENVSGSAFNDFLTGNSSDNTLLGNGGADVLDGGGGFDYVSYNNATAGVTASLANAAVNTGEAAGDSFISIEGLSGSSYDDVLIGNASDNWLEGHLGADQLDGGGGFDYASYFNALAGVTASLANPAGNTGEAAGDTYVSIEGLSGSAFADVLIGNSGDNWLTGQGGGDQLDGGAGNDFAGYSNARTGVTASLADSSVNTGEAMGDTYVSIENLGGSAFNDVLIGDSGSNTLRGQGGADVLDGGDGLDAASYVNASTGVTAVLDTSLGIASTGDAAGDTYISIEALSGSNFADILVGDASANILIGNSGADIFYGGAGNDTFYGMTQTSNFDGATDRVDYSRVMGLSQGISVNWLAGSVVGQAGIIDTDSMFGVEGVIGTVFADTFDSTGYSTASPRAGDSNGYQYIQGGGGNDTIIGNNNTEAAYGDATGGVTVTLSIVGGVYGGTASAAGVGTDQLTNVNRFIGTLYNDVFWGTSNAEVFDGYEGGDDVFHGGANNDTVEYDGGNRMAINVQLAAGIVTGRVSGSNIGTDTLDSIERIRGSEFADRFDATGFSGTSTNAGSSGTFNRFEGQGGADEVIGNGNTYLDYFNTGSGITVTMTGQGGGTVLATYGNNIAIDTFSGVLAINGGSSGDMFNGGTGSDTFFGQGGNDTLLGAAGNDTLDGGTGADVLNGGADFDLASYSTAATGVTASLINSASNTGDAAGDTYISIEGLGGSSFADILAGDALDNILIGSGGADIFYGGAGNDTFYGNTQTSGADGWFDRVDYSQVAGLSQGISVNWLAGSIVGQAGIIDTDWMFGIEAIFGTAFADTFDATGYSGASPRAGDSSGYQSIQGGGGNDTIIGNNNTEAAYGDATGGVTVTLGIVAGVYGGTATGAGVGTDQLTNVNRFVGSLYNDVFWGTINAETFDGYDGGNDVFHGGDNMDAVEYDGGSRMAIYVQLAAGIVTGRAAGSNIGTDTLDSIEQIRGSEFADRYDATGFSGSSTNAGSWGTFNRFEGQGGADEVIGNGNTYLDYFSTGSSVTVTMTGQGAGTVLATYGSNTATDTFTGVFAINGGNSNDTFNGAGGNDTFFGQGGNDVLLGAAGSDTLEGGTGADVLNGGADFDTASYANAASGVNASLANPGSNTGDAAGDSYISIEALTGSSFADTLTGDSGANTLTGNGGDDSLIGGAGADQLNGGDGADYASYKYAGESITASLANSSINTGEAVGDVYSSIERLEGSAYDDILFGDGLNNTLRGGLGADLLNGGGGFDYASYAAATGGVTASLANPGANTGEAAGDTYVSIEGLSGSTYADILIGDGGDNWLIGQGGADRLEGGGGTDIAGYSNATSGVRASLADGSVNTGEAVGDTYFSIEGLAGSAFNDILIGDGGNNILMGQGGADQLNGGGGLDSASYSTATAGLTASLDTSVAVNTGEAVGDTYTSIEGLIGSNFADTLVGDAGANALVGNGGDDVLVGGAGADQLIGGDGADYASYKNAGTGVTASLANSSANTGDAAGDTYSSIERLEGSAYSDILFGDGLDNTLRGGLGADQLNGGNGFDYASYFNAAAGVTVSLANSSVNTGEAAGDTYNSIEGISGSGLADILTGDGGDNWLIGQGGADKLDGGLGSDFAGYQNATAAVVASLTNSAINTGEAAGDSYISIENLGGSSYDDILIGDGGNNILRGQEGADRLEGGAGNDTASYFEASAGVTASLDTSLSVVNTGEAAGDTYFSIENLSGSNFADLLVGDAQDNILVGNAGGDIFYGGAGNDTFYGNAGTSNFDGAVDRADYSRVTGLSQGISVNWLAGTVVGQAGIIDTDSMFGIESVFGTGLADTFDATGYTSASPRYGDFSGFQFIQGGGGNDTIIGNGNTEAFYGDATGGVTVTLSIVSGVWGGTATGAGVGTDQLTNVNRFVGTRYDDVFWGTSNVEIFDGYDGGDDVFHGGANQDIVEYDGGARQAIDVKLAAGIVTGRAAGSNIGTDTLDSIERIRGSEFADRFDATGFSGTSANAGSSGTFNRFEGQGGADEVIGNGNTYLDYFNASAAVFVTMTGQGAGTAVATYGTNVATDSFSGIAAINGGSSSDSFVGGIGADNFFGQAGNDVLSGGDGDDTLEGGTGSDSLNGGAGIDYASYRNAGGGVTVNLTTGVGTFDAAGDTFTSIEGLIGTNFNDTLTGDTSGNILIGGLGADTLNGGDGGDPLIDVNYASYAYAQGGVTVSLLNPASNTGEAAGDTFTNITGLIGSNFNDTLIGSYYYVNFFMGGLGDDTLIGAQNSDVARYDTASGAVFINLGAGTVTGAAGNDTLVSIDHISGSNFADSYDASTYTAGTENTWDDLNVFEGFGGADTIVGSLTFDPDGMTSTVIEYWHATAGITVTMSGVASGTVLATYGTDTSTDTFSHVNRIGGSNFGDTFNGGEGAQMFRAGGGNDVLYGGAAADVLYGEAGDDQLYGGNGDDTLEGGAGADLLDGGSGADTVSYAQSGDMLGPLGVTASLENSSINAGEAAGDTYVSIENLAGTYANDTLIGNSGDNRIHGVNGADVFNGRGGLDTLMGNGGGDTYVFDSAIGAGNLATIVGYVHGQDHFNLDNAIFTQLGAAGQLSASAFVNGVAALDANDRIIFNSSAGTVMYDADGSGAGAAVVFATGLSSLDHTDFLIV